MYTAVIVDDEIDSQIALKGFLTKFCPQVEVVASFSTIVDCLQKVFRIKPDIMLLDINLSQGSGFDILNKIQELNTRVIFVTAHDEYAVEAFKHHVDNYILKPINHLDLQKAISKTIERISAKRELHELKMLIDKPEEKRIGVPIKDKLRIMSLQEIIRCEANGNYTIVMLNDREKVVVPKTIKKFEELLGMHGFIRTHQSHLINTQFMRNVDVKLNVVNLFNEDQIPISRKYKPKILDGIKLKFL